MPPRPCIGVRGSLPARTWLHRVGVEQASLQPRVFAVSPDVRHKSVRLFDAFGVLPLPFSAVRPHDPIQDDPDDQDDGEQEAGGHGVDCSTGTLLAPTCGFREWTRAT